MQVGACIHRPRAEETASVLRRWRFLFLQYFVQSVSAAAAICAAEPNSTVTRRNRACLQPPAGLLAGPWSVICSRLPQLYKLLAFIKRQTMSPTNALSCMSLMSVMAPSRQAIITLLCVFGSLMLANCGPEHHREFARIDDSEACCLSLLAAAVVGLGTQGPKCPRDPMGLCTESCPYLPACNLDE